jgi:hypothetical protein
MYSAKFLLLLIGFGHHVLASHWLEWWTNKKQQDTNSKPVNFLSLGNNIPPVIG